ELFPALDELATAKDRDLRRLRHHGVSRRYLVLRDAEIHPSRLSTHSTSSISARYPCDPTRHGLPVLPQFRRSGSALEFAGYPGLHELPSAGPKSQSEARAGARKLENRQTDRVG